MMCGSTQEKDQKVKKIQATPNNPQNLNRRREKLQAEVKGSGVLAGPEEGPECDYIISKGPTQKNTNGRSGGDLIQVNTNKKKKKKTTKCQGIPRDAVGGGGRKANNQKRETTKKKPLKSSPRGPPKVENKQNELQVGQCNRTRMTKGPSSQCPMSPRNNKVKKQGRAPPGLSRNLNFDKYEKARRRGRTWGGKMKLQERTQSKNRDKGQREYEPNGRPEATRKQIIVDLSASGETLAE